jgi:hypothetical protein
MTSRIARIPFSGSAEPISQMIYAFDTAQAVIDDTPDESGRSAVYAPPGARPGPASSSSTFGTRCAADLRPDHDRGAQDRSRPAAPKASSTSMPRRRRP